MLIGMYAGSTLSDAQRADASHVLKVIQDRMLCAAGILEKPESTRLVLATKLEKMLIELAMLRERLRGLDPRCQYTMPLSPAPGPSCSREQEVPSPDATVTRRSHGTYAENQRAPIAMRMHVRASLPPESKSVLGDLVPLPQFGPCRGFKQSGRPGGTPERGRSGCLSRHGRGGGL